MKINGQHYRSIWLDEDPAIPAVCIFNQLQLPYQIVIERLTTTELLINAIKSMQLRGAPLIGAAGAMGVYLAVNEFMPEIILGKLECFFERIKEIKEARPTAVNLAWAVDEITGILKSTENRALWLSVAKQAALKLVDDDAEMSKKIGIYGVELIKQIQQTKKGRAVNILTHCNAGWLATIDYGTATAPIYEAVAQNIPVHVWVDETRPRNQGARLTAWELEQAGVSHTVIADNTGGHLMQHGMVDLCIVGCDRATINGDAANKIGTYLKALAANDNQIPFYVALPSSTFDWLIEDGVKEIPIEERDGDEIRYTEGWLEGELVRVISANPGSPVVNFGFDVTPARLITGFITERGICPANKAGIMSLFPERAKANLK